MKNCYESVEINDNLNCPYIPDYHNKTLMIDGSGSGKTNVLLINLIKHQRPNIGKIFLHVKDPFDSKYQLLINRREIYLKISKVLIDYSQTIDDVYENS